MCFQINQKLGKLELILVSIVLFGSNLVGCNKVGLIKKEMNFAQFNSFWFQKEQTQFIFYEISGDPKEKLPKNGVVEISFSNFSTRLDSAGKLQILPDDQMPTDPTSDLAEWININDIPLVHKHVKADCKTASFCGSISMKLTQRPFNVRMRYRFHKDGKDYQVKSLSSVNIRSREDHDASFLVYGVFDESNRRVQWRGRHNFPGISHKRVMQLGLRREFQIDQLSTGKLSESPTSTNFTLTGMEADCSGFVKLEGWSKIHSEEGKKIWHEGSIPDDLVDEPIVCGETTIKTAIDPIKSTAFAQKNPLVSPIQGQLRVENRPTEPLHLIIKPCFEALNDEFYDFQKSRLAFGSNTKTLCMDDASTFVGQEIYRVVTELFENRQTNTDDTHLKIMVHHGKSEANVGAINELVQGLMLVFADHGLRISPRITASFVYQDTTVNPILLGKDAPEIVALAPYVIWCPSVVVDERGQNSRCQVWDSVATRGILKISALPIFPSYDGYKEFVDSEGTDRLGKVKGFKVMAPYLEPGSKSYITDELLYSSFYENETVSSHNEARFSYCALEEKGFQLVYMKAFGQGLNEDDKAETVKDPFKEIPRAIAFLPQEHNKDPFPGGYHLGVAFDFAALFRFDYSMDAEIAIGYLPIRQKGNQTNIYGEEQWTNKTIELGRVLLRCDQFCSHPSFDKNGSYQLGSSWEEVYGNRCYEPKFPVPD